MCASSRVCRDVEVRTVESVALVQRLDLPKAKFISQGAAVYIASPSNCWRLEPVDLATQIKDVLALGEFEEALHLADRIDEGPAQKRERIFNIKRSFAFAQFAKRQFEAAMKTFSELEIDPTHIIGLYPGLLNAETRAKNNCPKAIPNLSGVELETALSYLVNYLTNKRNELAKQADAADAGDDPRRAELSQIIDTTLLKCYLKTNAALVGPLLRVSNSCAVEESEVLLKDHERFNELVMLYKGRGMHRQALELLYEHGQKKGKLSGHFHTMQYLQRLGPDHIDLITEFSKWVLKFDAEDGYAIFTADDYPEIALLPQEKVGGCRVKTPWRGSVWWKERRLFEMLCAMSLRCGCVFKAVLCHSLTYKKRAMAM